MNLKPGVNIPDVMDGNELHIFVCPDLLEDSVKVPSLLTSPDKGSRGIKGQSIPFERDDIASDLFLFFKKEGSQTLLGQEGCGGQAAHPRPDNDPIPTLIIRHVSHSEPFKEPSNYNRFIKELGYRKIG
jgi:hypothetical protein